LVEPRGKGLARYTLSHLAQAAGARVVGEPEREIDGVGTLSGARPGQITFLTNPRYRKQLQQTQASAVVIAEADLPFCPVDALVAARPHVAYARISALFAPAAGQGQGIHGSAVISPAACLGDDVEVGPGSVIEDDAVLGDGVRVGPGCYIGAGSRLGEGTRLVANVTVYHGCRIGARVLVHAGAVIGSDGFGFADDGGTWVKVHQLGGVRIGDDVEIGACTTIDRGAVEDTVIEDGVKLDNQIQVAHNVRIGAHTAIAGCVGIAGSARIGRHCAIAGGVGILGHLEIADRVTVTAMSLVTKSIKEPGVYSAGTPLEPIDRWQKNFARFKQLDDMARRIRALEQELAQINKGSSR